MKIVWEAKDIENGIECEVLDGRESSYECPALTDFLDAHEVPCKGRNRWG